MRTINSIRIVADPDLVYRTAAAVLDWPRMLPHYRWVRLLDGDGDTGVVEMAARRSWIPVKWVSAMWLHPGAREIRFEHIGGITRGMEVLWSVSPGDGGAVVSIVHELSLKVPIVRSVPGKLITGRVFVEHIADQTLRYMKQWVEKQ